MLLSQRPEIPAPVTNLSRRRETLATPISIRPRDDELVASHEE
jgi:hypothetical protein